MEIMHYLFYGWIFCTIAAYQADESISFSPIKLNSVSKSSSSYWYGNITIPTDSSILEEEIYIKLYVNRFQGLLFYTIDSKYRTLWVEFTKDTLKLSFYNFKIREPDNRYFKLPNLCTHITDNKVDLKFSLRNEEITITCNGNTLKTVYVKQFDPLSENDMQHFLDGMTLPIPYFGNESVFDDQSNLVHLWIGNTPSDNINLYRNTGELLSNGNHLWGCIKSFSVRNTVVKLATTGYLYGEMVTPFCNPQCYRKPCSNDAQCFELWRERFRCDCGYSQFIGELCNEDYSLKFLNDMTLEEAIDFKFKRLQFSFKLDSQMESTGNKLLSLKFLSNQFLYIYTDINDNLQARFVAGNGINYDVRFAFKITSSKIYTVFIDTDVDGINFKIADSSTRYLIDRRSIQLNQVNLIIQHIMVGDSHAISMQWIKKFTGCISNLFLDSGRTTYAWNKFINFNKMPKCGEPETITKSTEQPTYGTHPDNYTLFAKKPIFKMDKTNGEVKISRTSYIIIIVTVVLVFVVSIIIIAVFKLKSNRKKSRDSKNQRLIINDQQKPPPELAYPMFTPHFYASANGSPMTYKPPYKARSMSYSSNGKSMNSLPTANTPTLVTPEDNEMLL